MTCQSLGQVHSDWVRRVKYIPVKEFVISCSGSGKDSLVVRDIDDKKRKTYTFKVAKVNTHKETTGVQKNDKFGSFFLLSRFMTNIV